MSDNWGKKSGHAYVAHPDELENLIVTEEVILPKLLFFE